MLPVFNMRYRNSNMAILQPHIEKMKRGELTLELILEEDEIIQDLKTNPNSQFINMLSDEAIRKLIDYSTKMPKSNDKNVGFKYPFNATEILCCDNNAVMERIMHELKMEGDYSNDSEDGKEEGEKDNKEEENEEFFDVKEDDNKGQEPEVVQEKEEPEKKNEEKSQEEPKQEEPKNEENQKEEPPKEEPKQEEPKKEEENKEEAKPQEAKIEEPKKEEEKKEEEKKEEIKPEETKKEEVKKEEIKPEETKKEEETQNAEPQPKEAQENEEAPKEEQKKEGEEKSKEEIKKEEQQKEEIAKEEPAKQEEQKKEEEKKEEIKKEEGEEGEQTEKSNKTENAEEQKQEVPEPQKNEEENEKEEPKQEENENLKAEEENEKEEEQEKDDEEQQQKEIVIIYDNIDYLLGFLKESEETKTNYVLVGYFYKILNHLFNSQQSKIIQYLFDYPKKNEFDVLGLMVKNMRRKSMGEIINKLLLFQDDSGDEFLPKKLELLEKVLEELKETDEEDKYECICSTLESTFYNKGFFIEFMKVPKLLELIYSILENTKNDSKKLIAILRLLINIHENILKNEEDRCTISLAPENPMDFLSMFNGTYNLDEGNQKDSDPDLQKTVDVLILK